MRTQVIFCSACDREVTVIPRVDPVSGAPAELAGAMCTEEDERCTGSLCPICAVPIPGIRPSGGGGTTPGGA